MIVMSGVDKDKEWHVMRMMVTMMRMKMMLNDDECKSLSEVRYVEVDKEGTIRKIKSTSSVSCSVSM